MNVTSLTRPCQILPLLRVLRSHSLCSAPVDPCPGPQMVGRLSDGGVCARQEWRPETDRTKYCRRCLGTEVGGAAAAVKRVLLKFSGPQAEPRPLPPRLSESGDHLSRSAGASRESGPPRTRGESRVARGGGKGAGGCSGGRGAERSREERRPALRAARAVGRAGTQRLGGGGGGRGRVAPSGGGGAGRGARSPGRAASSARPASECSARQRHGGLQRGAGF